MGQADLLRTSSILEGVNDRVSGRGASVRLAQENDRNQVERFYTDMQPVWIAAACDTLGAVTTAGPFHIRPARAFRHSGL